MRRVYAGLLAFTAAIMIAMSAGSQPPEEKEKDGPPEKKGPPRFEIGKVLPPFIREEINLSPEQKQQIRELEREVKEKLSKILTDEQIKRIDSIRPKGMPGNRKGPPDDFEKKGPPDDFEKKGPPDDFEKKGPPEGKGRRKPADGDDRNGPPDDFEKKGPPDDFEKKGPPQRKKKGPQEKGDRPDRPLAEKPQQDEDLPQPRLKEPGKNLIRNSRLTLPGATSRSAADFTLKGDVARVIATHVNEFSPHAVALNSGGSNRSGSISQDVAGFEGGAGRWFRYTFRGFPESHFAVNSDALFMRVEFFGNKGTNPLDGVTKKIYPQIELDRKNLAVNGNFRKNGGAAWKNYELEFKLPFSEIDQLRVSVGFENGAAGGARDACFYVTDLALEPIAAPADAPKVLKTDKGRLPSRQDLIPLGGRWYYEAEPGLTEKPARLIVNADNAHRLWYLDSRLTTPFAGQVTAWLRKGHMDVSGKVVESDRFLPDNVVIEFSDAKAMIVRAKNIPNHPTGQFPERLGGKMGNSSYIQEHNYTYYLPLNPVPNPRAVAMDKTNSNRALPMGSTALALNGVVFYNPFDAGNRDASDIMDRCCGHPSPDYRYHYHKYPVCVKTPFVDEGEEHSPLIGFAFDGFPIYGPYESKGLMAKDDKANPLNDFNIHYDEEHGWHYHVTPGKFPYVIGGYWGDADRRNGDRKGPGFPPKR